MINFSKLKQEALDVRPNSTLQLLLCGAQGSGKSTTSGTLCVPTLYLYGSGESHGPDQAKIFGKDNITPLNWDYNPETGEPLTPDQSYKLLVQILNDETLKDNFEAVVVDGATELTYNLIRHLKKFRDKCLTTKGEHNAFKEGEATLDLLKPVMGGIKSLYKQGVHTVMTMILDVQQTGLDGEVMIAKPSLPTYGITTGLVPQFNDIAIVSRVEKHPKGDGHYLQFGANMKRISKDDKGSVKKSISFSPRLAGVAMGDLPKDGYGPADLKGLAAFKARKMGGE
jgi:hypothetical protein